MTDNIYVRLLNEGTTVYRPVPALQIEDNIYQLEGSELYDPEDETWEFIPGAHVMVQEQLLQNKSVLVAVAHR
ncbi:hypothetical protein SAMN05428988_3814 [Chitinophaga sp. YR573]|nr:hypothetical protein SAMN05428988_3814 [Chitinophaga sp. YR573]